MTTFNYKKWVTDYKQGKLLFEHPHNSYLDNHPHTYTGSYTGSSSTGSYAPCIQNQQANSSVTSNPQLGDVGINQNFINNMQGKPTVFYQTKANTFFNKLTQLRSNNPVPGGGGYYGFCQGSNPHWQAQINNKYNYAQNCMQNPGSC